ncbi:PIG-L family deacetylase [Citricoccus sp. SGAir0253]|uniref:PIG-L deacetylase family protein n=1 Tax=Citricoccus sp. SGAir0253 TaxID=2567881 RepID=UPI0010CCFAA8|nr:PIG-L deacetylase family protein [Citricoccus sp. SGAir0253]QCU77736.1 PIG-L family deacetylase [Citricoccus sp. SGAir0253]
MSGQPLPTPAEVAATHGWRRVLAFGAHPDDLDFGAAATVAGLTRAGVEVTYCVMTDGDAGGFEAEDHHTITTRRQQEQRDAAALLGVRDVEFLGERDGYLEPTHAVIEQVVARMRRHRPDAVLAMHPERDWDRLQRSHPDHLAVGEAVVRASYPAVENPFAYPRLAEQGLEAYRLPWLVLYGGPAARTNLVVDVTGAEQDKLRALRHHVSQHPDVPRMEAFVLRGMAELHRRWSGPGAAAGEDAPERYAEGFHLVAVNDASTISGF